MLPLALAPFIALFIENVILYSRGRRVSATITRAGMPVTEPLFARSPRDVHRWARRNSVDLTDVRTIGAASKRSPVEGRTAFQAVRGVGVRASEVKRRQLQ